MGTTRLNAEERRSIMRACRGEPREPQPAEHGKGDRKYRARGVAIDPKDATCYIELQAPVSGRRRLDGMAAWRDRLLGLLMRNSMDATDGYQIPNAQVMHLGLRVRS